MFKRFMESLLRKPDTVEDRSWIDDLFPDAIAPFEPVYGQLIGRGQDSAFHDAHSWFGGLPQIGDMPWPRAACGMAMAHVATVDLAQVPHHGVPLPDSGQLAFFLPMGNDRQEVEAAVRYIPDPAPTRCPDDLPEISRMSGGTFQGPLPFHVETRLLTYYPLSLTANAPQGPGPFDPPHAVGLTARTLAHVLPNGDKPWLWDSAHRLAATLPRSASVLDEGQARAEKSLATTRKRLADAEAAHAAEPTGGTENALAGARKMEARAAQDLAAFETLREDYSALIEQANALVRDQDPWAEMPPSAVDALDQIMESLAYSRYQEEVGKFGVLYRCGDGLRFQGMSDLTSHSLAAMAVAPPEVFGMLPEQVQRFIVLNSDDCRRHATVQMFGTGTAIQDANELNADKHMLMQFSGADAQGLAHGAIKVWITPDDLDASAFDRVSVSYEYD